MYVLHLTCIFTARRVADPSDLSQDLLEAVVDGPDVDLIYEIYASEHEPGEGDDPARMGEEEGVDPDVYAEMDDDVMIID